MQCPVEDCEGSMVKTKSDKQYNSFMCTLCGVVIRKPIQVEPGKAKKQVAVKKAAPVEPSEPEEVQVAKKRVRKEKKGPTRTRSAYMYFSQAWRKKARDNHPNDSVSDITRRLADAWKILSPAKKAPYQAKSDADKERYKKEKEAFEALEKKPVAKKAKKAAVVPVEEIEQEEVEEEPLFVDDEQEEIDI
jgi:hypothetical protein